MPKGGSEGMSLLEIVLLPQARSPEQCSLSVNQDGDRAEWL